MGVLDPDELASSSDMAAGELAGELARIADQSKRFQREARGSKASERPEIFDIKSMARRREGGAGGGGGEVWEERWAVRGCLAQIGDR